MIDAARDSILAHCGVNSATHELIFNSGASEGNCYIIRSCVRTLKRRLAERGCDSIPHIIVSAIEHNSIMSCVRDLVADGEIEASFVQPSMYGTIAPADVISLIRPTTCLISIMHANNEIPVVNNITAIVNAVNRNKRTRHIPVHTDAVQVFGKVRCNIKTLGVQALTASAHKFYGPKSVGILIMSKHLVKGYGLTAEIAGSQQSGLRGGTENVAGIAAFEAALKAAFTSRSKKNAKLWALRQRLLERLADVYTMAPYTSYTGVNGENGHEDLELVSLGPRMSEAQYILRNTLLLAICKNRGKPFCNVDLVKYLDKRGISVAVGSACNTHSQHASHVLDAIGAPDVVKRGVIRISFGDHNTMGEINRFLPALRQGIAAQCNDI